MTDRVGFITGASRGVGAAVARAFHGDGMKVALASRSGDDLGLDGALGLECDVRDPDAVAAAVDAAVAEFGRLDVVVANAGVGAYGPFLEMDPEDVEAMIDINLKGTLYTARFTLPAPDREQGRLRLARLGRRAAGVPRGGRLQRVQVRDARASRARSTTSCASRACA